MSLVDRLAGVDLPARDALNEIQGWQSRIERNEARLGYLPRDCFYKWRVAQ